VTFGATDAPLKGEELDKFGLVQFPMVMGGIVPVVNIEGMKPGELVLDGPAVAAIFLGKVKSWDDPLIKELNPNAKLPSQPIAVVHRSDGSGTTFNFTYYLALVSPDWKSQVGTNTSVEWPIGIGAKGNEGVSNNVSQTNGFNASNISLLWFPARALRGTALSLKISDGGVRITVLGYKVPDEFALAFPAVDLRKPTR
jgi:phosphate transport system substrate-binding protein